MKIMVYVMLAAGFVLLIKGADFFVEASSSVARKLRIPSIIVGLTVVAFGTSAPELAVSTAASLAGNNEIAVSNVIGSNIFNLLAVLGACGAIRAFPVRLRWDFAAAIAAAVLLLFMILRDMFLSRIEAFVLLGMFIAFLVMIVKDGLKNRVEAEEEKKTIPFLLCLVYGAGGLAAIVCGGDLVVDCASQIAANFGLSQTLIGLTVVAMGTSLPELVTSVVASRKGENAMALGNVLGSNIFNVLMVLAISAAVKPIAVNLFAVVDAACLVAFSLIALILCRTRDQISQKEGVAMLVMYTVYMVYICIR